MKDLHYKSKKETNENKVERFTEQHTKISEWFKTR
jgi:hypothetical protein